MSFERRDSDAKSDSHLSDEKTDFQQIEHVDHLKGQVTGAKKITEANNGGNYVADIALVPSLSHYCSYFSRIRCGKDQGCSESLVSRKSSALLLRCRVILLFYR